MGRKPGTYDYKLATCLLAAALGLLGQTTDRGRALHASSLVFDGHVHAIDREFYHGGDIGSRKADGQFDLPRAKEGGLGALLFSIFVTERGPGESTSPQVT